MEPFIESFQQLRFALDRIIKIESPWDIHLQTNNTEIKRIN